MLFKQGFWLRENCTQVYRTPYGTMAVYCTSLHKCLTTGAAHEFNHATSVTGTSRFRMLNNPTAVGSNSSLRDAVDIRRANRRWMTHCCTACINVRCATLVLNIKRIYLSKRGSNWGVGMETVGWLDKDGVGWAGSSEPEETPITHGFLRVSMATQHPTEYIYM